MPILSKKLDELNAKVRRLEQENAILKDAADSDTQTIKNLRADLAEATEKIKAYSAPSAVKAREMAERMVSLERQLECSRAAAESLRGTIDDTRGLTKTQKARRWRYITDKGPYPKEGAVCLCACANFGAFCEDVASRRNTGLVDYTLRKARYVGGGEWHASEIPCGYAVVAWQDLPPACDMERVIDRMTTLVGVLRLNPKEFETALLDPDRLRMNPAAEKRRVSDLIRGVESAVQQRIKRRQIDAENLAREMMRV